MFKRLFLLLSVGILCWGSASAQQDTLWTSANTAYINANYEEAIRQYEQMLTEGWESSKLYYNLGNAYFKRGMNGKAILNYRKAQRLAPANDDIRYNLAIANTYVKDQIETVPVFFLKRWMVNLGHSMSSNTWAVLSLCFFGAMLVGAGTYLLLRRRFWQKVGFFGALASLVFFLCAVIYAMVGRSERLHPTEAIIMHSAVPVKSSPDAGSKEIFVLHEGTEVEVCSTLGDWSEIRIADGNKGWLKSDAMERVD